MTDRFNETPNIRASTRIDVERVTIQRKKKNIHINTRVMNKTMLTQIVGQIFLNNWRTLS